MLWVAVWRVFLHLGFHRGTGLGKSWSRRWVLRMKHVHLSQWVWVPFSVPFFCRDAKKTNVKPDETWNGWLPKKRYPSQKRIVLGVHETVPSSFPLGFSRLARLGMHLVLCWNSTLRFSLRPYLGMMAWWTSLGVSGSGHGIQDRPLRSL